MSMSIRLVELVKDGTLKGPSPLLLYPETGNRIENADRIKALIEATRHTDSYVRSAARVRLRELDSYTYIQSLIIALKDIDPFIRLNVIKKIAEIGPYDRGRDAVDVLTYALKDPDFHCRGMAVYALGEIGSYASSAIPSLTSISSSNDEPYVKENAKYALSRITGTY